MSKRRHGRPNAKTASKIPQEAVEAAAETIVNNNVVQDAMIVKMKLESISAKGLLNSREQRHQRR